MNILILTHSYPDEKSSWKGAFIREQARSLSLLHDITVVHFEVDYSRLAPFSRYRFIEKSDGPIKIYKVTTSRSFPVINQLKYLSDTFSFIRNEILNKKQIDIIHSHFAYPAGFLGTMIRRRKKIPDILTEHTWVKKYFRSFIHKFCVLTALRKASVLIAVSNALKENISGFCTREVEVIPNVIDFEKFIVRKKERADVVNLGILGGMSNYRKGLDILLKSISLIDKTGIKLHIGGAGIHLEKFKQLARDLGVYENCIFYGEIAPEQINNFYSAIDVFVLSSRDETFGVVVIEAMACGLPVVATRCGGPQEIVTPETGVLVPVEDPEELAKAIISVSNNLESYDPVKIKEYASSRYGQASYNEKADSLYRKAVEDKS
jgi:glycosyltransferase involved in cell wall biosynthesis